MNFNRFQMILLAAPLLIGGLGACDEPLEDDLQTEPKKNRNGGMTSFLDGDSPDKPVFSIEAFAEATSWGSLPIYGEAPPGSTLVHRSPVRGTVTETVDASGFFCIDIPLRKAGIEHADGGLRNEIFMHIELEGEASNILDLEVVQKGDQPGYAFPNQPRNVALGAIPVMTNFSVFEGEAKNITDGDRETSAKAYHPGVLSGDGYAPQFQLRLSPEQGANIQSIRFDSPEKCKMNTYYIYYSDSDDPEKLIYQHGNSQGSWTRVASSLTSEPNKSFKVKGSPRAKWVAVWVHDGECTPLYSYGHFAVSEIEVIGVDYVDPNGPQPGAPACQ